MKIIKHREYKEYPCDLCNGDGYMPDGEMCSACMGSGTVLVTEPPVGECHCGQEIVLEAFTNTCDHCGTDYNFAGQQLAPRSQWGEETGEPWQDCY